MRRWTCGAALLLYAGGVAAQISASVTLLSDYRYRGLSFNDGKPTPQLSVNMDGEAGWYAGGLATPATLQGRAMTQLVSYAGYAQRMAAGWSWEAGATESAFSRAGASNYGEVYLGLSGERVSGRLYYAPRYFGYDTSTLYGEVNGFYPLLDQLNLTAHAGLLHTLAGAAWPGVPADSRYDLRVGVSAPVRDWNLQLVWVLSQRNDAQYARYDQRAPHAVLLSAAYNF